MATQDSLFEDPEAPKPPDDASTDQTAPALVKPSRPVKAAKSEKATQVQPLAPDPQLRKLIEDLPPQLRLGTSSWYFPGWAGLVWEGDYQQAVLSKHGLPAYVQHPLFRTVSIDRTFYRPLTASQFAAYAAQVPDDFRFVVKAPSLIADAMVRGDDGRGMQPNPAFLDPQLAIEQFVQPALDGLGSKIGALIFQLSPLPGTRLARMPQVLDQLRTMLAALPSISAIAPLGAIAVEVRNPEFLTSAFTDVLRETGATYCLGLHPKLPPIKEQIPLLRALWPGPLVCRWSLNRLHGAYGYEEARELYLPFDTIVDPDPETHAALARVIAGTTGAGYPAYVTISNKAEGSAPLTVLALAEEVRRQTR